MITDIKYQIEFLLIRLKGEGIICSSNEMTFYNSPKSFAFYAKIIDVEVKLFFYELEKIDDHDECAIVKSNSRILEVAFSKYCKIKSILQKTEGYLLSRNRGVLAEKYFEKAINFQIEAGKSRIRKLIKSSDDYDKFHFTDYFLDLSSRMPIQIKTNEQDWKKHIRYHYMIPALLLEVGYESRIGNDFKRIEDATLKSFEYYSNKSFLAKEMHQRL